MYKCRSESHYGTGGISFWMSLHFFRHKSIPLSQASCHLEAVVTKFVTMSTFLVLISSIMFADHGIFYRKANNTA